MWLLFYIACLREFCSVVCLVDSLFLVCAEDKQFVLPWFFDLFRGREDVTAITYLDTVI